MLKNNIQQVGLMIGRLFMPVVKAVLPWLNAMAMAVKDLMQYIGDLFGIKWDNSSMAMPDDMDTGYEDLEEDASGAADAIEDATDAQKKFNKQLQGFDKLNNLTSQDKDKDKDEDKDGEGGATDTSGVLSDALIKAVEDYEKRWNTAFEGMTSKADELKKKIEELFKAAWITSDGSEIGAAIAGVLNKAIEWVNTHSDEWTEGLKKIASIMATSLNGFISGTEDSEGLDWEGLGSAIGTSIKGVLEAEEEFFDDVDWTNLGSSLATTLNTAIDTGVIEQYFETMASKIKSAIETAFGFVTTFDFLGLGTSIGNGINDAIKKMGEVNEKTGKTGWEMLAISLSEGIKGALQTALGTVTTIKWEDIGQAIADFISGMDTSGIGWELGLLVNSLATAFYNLVSKKDTWVELGQKIAEGINAFFKGMDEVSEETGLTGWQALGEGISDTIVGILTSIKTALDETQWKKIGQSIADFIGSINWEDIVWNLGGVISSFTTALSGILSGATGMPEGLSNLIVKAGIGGWIISKVAKTKLGAAIISKLGTKFAVGLMNVIGKVKSWIVGAINKTGLVTKIANKVGKITTTLKNVAAKISSWAVTKVANLKNAIVAKVGKISTTFTKVGATVKNWLPTLGKGGKLTDLIAGIKTELGITKGALSIGNIATKIAISIPTFAFPDMATDDLVRRFDQWLYHALGDRDVVDLAVDIVISIKDFVIDTGKGVGEWFKGLWTDTTDITDAIDVGNDIANGILKGIANALLLPAEFIYNLIIKPIKDALGIHSPSTVARDEIGKFIGEGVIEGIKNSISNKWDTFKTWWSENVKLPNFDDISVTIKGIKDATFTEITTWWDNTKETAKELWAKAKGKINNTFEDVKTAWSSFREGTKNVFVKAKGKIEDAFNSVKTAWSSFREGTKVLWAKAKGKVEDTFNSISQKWASIKEGAKELLARAKGSIETTFDDAATAWENFKEGTKNLLVEAKGNIENTFNNAATAWENFKTGTKELLLNAKGNVEKAFSDASQNWNNIKDKTKDLLLNAKGKIEQGFDDAKTAWKNISDKTATLVASAKQEASNVFNTISGIWSNIKSKTAKLTANAQQNSTSIFNAISEKWNTIKSKTAKLTAKAKQDNQSVFQTISNKWSALTNKTAELTATFNDAFTHPLKTAWNAIARTINGAINLINKIPGVEIKAQLPLLAKGTLGLPIDTLGIVNDQKGSTYREMIVPPKGLPFIPEGRNVALAMKKGTKVIPADKTKEFFSSLQHFANGIGRYKVSDLLQPNSAASNIRLSDIFTQMGNDNTVEDYRKNDKPLAVDNNQIVTSVSEGVSDAVFNSLAPVLTKMTAAINDMNKNGKPLYVEGLSDGDIVRITTDANRQYKKQFGRPLYT